METQVALKLADIYFRKKKNKEALRIYRELAPKFQKNSAEYTNVLERINQLD
jgi:hypothetical protein